MNNVNTPEARSHYKEIHTYNWNMVLLAAKRLSESNETVNLETQYEWENLIIRLRYYRFTVLNLNQLSPGMTSKIVKQFDSIIAGGDRRLGPYLPDSGWNYNFDAHLFSKNMDRYSKSLLDITASGERIRFGRHELNFPTIMQAANELKDGVIRVSRGLIEW